VNPPATVPYFFTRRDEFRADREIRTDLALNYAYRLTGKHRHEFFGQVQVLNLFNEFQLVDGRQGGNINLGVLTRATTPARYQPFNPFTSTAVQGINWDFGPDFGKPLGSSAYTLPRTFLVTFGFRY
jgi:hypothetical protein